MSQRTNDIETINLLGKITNTSKKQSGKYKSNNPRKSLYLELDADSTKRAIDFGLTEYTSKEDNENFFIIQASETIKVYDEQDKKTLIATVSGKADDDSDNFTSGDKVLEMAIMKGENMGRTFYRLFGVLGDYIVENESASPF